MRPVEERLSSSSKGELVPDVLETRLDDRIVMRHSHLQTDPAADGLSTLGAISTLNVPAKRHIRYRSVAEISRNLHIAKTPTAKPLKSAKQNLY
ncbi:unnamed protein product [Protopolystoma xenopodis]|uniref:Uncharacterized protein n=1 Tax=Protopolystoma xenopodis TaxID=117903 RepID=A0A448XLK9_9PLAT|nr:unnamed protein product [Protopolystoma xenopodis]